MIRASRAARIPGSRWFAALAVTACLAGSAGVAVWLETDQRSGARAQEREHLEARLRKAAHGVRGSFEQLSKLLRTIAPVSWGAPSIGPEQFDDFIASQVGFPTPPGLLSAQVVRQGVVIHVYPLDLHRALLGSAVPWLQRRLPSEAVPTHISDTLLLRPEGQESRGHEYWLCTQNFLTGERGIPGASLADGALVGRDLVFALAIDLDAVLSSAGLSAHDHALGPRGGDPVWGSADLEPARTASVPLTLMGRDWELRAAPLGRGGLPSPWQLRISVGLVGVLLAILVWFGLRRPAILQAAVDRATRELEENAGRLRALLHSTPVGIVHADAQGRCTFVNPRWEELTGLSNEQSCSEDWLLALHPDDRARVTEAWTRFVGGQGEFSHEFRFVHADGQEVWVAGSAIPIRDPAGELLGHTGVLLDISARKRAQAEREEFEARVLHAQKLESLGVLAGGIAHDFNNLLVGLMAHADLALRSVPADSSVRSHLERMIGITNRAAELCNQMLSYAGRDAAEMRTLDLSQVLEEIPQLLGVSTSRKAVISYELDRDLPAVQADAGQMRQVLMNLVINASEATRHTDGRILIRTGSHTIGSEHTGKVWFGEEPESGRYVFVEVRDDGVGMTKETMDRMFEPFFTTKFSGRGLGMSAVLGIVRSHGGFLEVESAVGRGSTFRVYLPASPGTPAGSVADAVPVSGWRGGGTVLLVDDEESVRQASGLLLQHLGCEVLAASSGRQAVELFKRNTHAIRLVLLDLTMPGMGGEECLGALMRIRPDVCVVMSSGFGERDVVDRLFASGARDFIRKPYDLAGLRAMLERNLGGRGRSRELSLR